MKTNLWTALVILLHISYFGFGQSILSNDINDTDPSAFNPYSAGQVVDPNIGVSGIGRGGGLTSPPGNTANRYNARSWTATFNSTRYFYFTITPNPGYKIDFSSFVYTGEASNQGPSVLAFRSSVDGYTANIGTPTIVGTTIDLSSPTYQNISSAITFRIYAWGGTNGNGTFSINDFIFNGSVSLAPCVSTSTWNGTNWSPVVPNQSRTAIINGNYNTSDNGDFKACSLTIESTFRLTVNNLTYVEIINDVIVNGQLQVETQGSFVQKSNYGTFTLNAGGRSFVNKRTSFLANWYNYTYWSSPVTNETIGTALFTSDRRYWFNASNFEDGLAEVGNTGVFNPGQDDFDDNNNDWQVASSGDLMIPGVGYAATHTKLGFVPNVKYQYQFSGPFNTGAINVPVVRNDVVIEDNDWNFVGNPYPSAISADVFFALNNYNATLNPSGTLDGAIYLWSQNTPPSSTSPGNAVLNFSQSDYAIINGSTEIAGGSGDIPNRYIPSGQGIFVTFSKTRASNTGNVFFNNTMRRADGISNSQFFRSSKSKISKTNVDNKLWISLTSDNGVFNQIAVAYVEGATDADDGAYYDAIRNLSSKNASIIYSLINRNKTKKFAIQGKHVKSLNKGEIISLGFYTSIDESTIYNLSIAKLQGEFLLNNTIYIKDKLLKKWHDLKESDYQFTSDTGEFNERFEIVFNKNNFDNNKLNNNRVSITNLGNNNINFKISDDLVIKNVKIYEALLGKELYHFKGNSSSEIFTFPPSNNIFYIAKIQLSNGATITRKIVL